MKLRKRERERERERKKKPFSHKFVIATTSSHRLPPLCLSGKFSVA